MEKSTRTALWGGGALLVAGLAAGIAALFAFGSDGGTAVQQPIVQPAEISKPPRGALVLAAEAGSRAVALAVERGARPRLTATVLSGSGEPESGLAVSFRVGGSSVPAHPCGKGCYSALVPAGASLRRVDVSLAGGSVAFRVPATTRPGSAIVARATRAFRRLRSLVYVESLRSGPTKGLVTTWRFEAPNRLSYRIHGGAAGIVIGARRWDQTDPGGRWTKSEATAVRVPAATWGGPVTNARVLGNGRIGDRPVWIVSFATPSVPAWFTAWIDRRSYRTLRLRMTAAAHFMVHRYTSFNTRVKIRPPG
jgi:hypothetical protein